MSDGWIYWEDSMKAVVTGVEREDVLPLTYKLEQNYPNPFNPSTTIRFEIPKQSHVTLTIYDILGREVASLVNETLDAGAYNTDWNAERYPSGVYFYKFEASNFLSVKKMILLK
jgi:hypothetical protein